MIRKISNKELCDLSEDWENSKVDRSKYYDNVVEAYEVDKEVFDGLKNDGVLCQEQDGKYYVAGDQDIYDILGS